MCHRQRFCIRPFWFTSTAAFAASATTTSHLTLTTPLLPRFRCFDASTSLFVNAFNVPFRHFRCPCFRRFHRPFPSPLCSTLSLPLCSTLSLLAIYSADATFIDLSGTISLLAAAAIASTATPSASLPLISQPPNLPFF